MTAKSRVVMTQKYGARLTPPGGMTGKVARDWARNHLVKMIEEAGHSLEGEVETHILPATGKDPMQVAAIADIWVLDELTRRKMVQAYKLGHYHGVAGRNPDTTPYDSPNGG